MFPIVADVVTALCVAALFAAVVANFLENAPGRAFRERRSRVATATMTGFFLVLYATIRLRWGMLDRHGAGWLAFRSAGLALMLLGTAVNVRGRLHLGDNWADHVRVYGNQQLITSGPYRWIRHPLYASLIWMFYGAAMAYLSPLAALETTLVFLPAMVYRSNQEEQALTGVFGDAYRDYRARTGRFLPRLPRWRRSAP